MALTESRKQQTESEVEMEALVDPGVWSIEDPGLAKDIQPVVIKQDPQEMAGVHCRGHQSQIPRSEIGKGNHHVDQEAKKAACTPTDKIKAVLHVPGLIEEMPQLCYAKKENWAKHKGLISLRGWYMLDEKIMIPQTQWWKVIKALPETIHDKRDTLWNLLQRQNIVLLFQITLLMYLNY